MEKTYNQANKSNLNLLKKKIIFPTILFIFILFFNIILIKVNFSQNSNVLFIEDATPYLCKIKKINKVNPNYYGIRIEVNVNDTLISHYIITNRNNERSKYKRIKVGKKYKLILSRYHEVSYIRTHTQFINSVLIGDKIHKITYDYSFPWVMLTPNLEGLNYIPIEKSNVSLSNYNIEEKDLKKFVYNFIYNISFSHDEKFFYEFVDSTSLKNIIIEDCFSKSLMKNEIKLSTFMFDSLYHKKGNNKINNSLKSFMENDISIVIVLIKNDILNVRVKWKMPDESYPRSAMLAVNISNEKLKVVGFSRIPLVYTNEYPK